MSRNGQEGSHKFSMNIKKKRQHKIVEKTPVVAALLMCVLWSVLQQLIAFVVNLLLSLVISGYNDMSGPVGLVVSIAVMMAVYKWWFRPEFEGMLKGDLPKGFLLGLFELGFVILSFLLSALTGYQINPKPLSAQILFVSLAAGMSEELVFRGVVVSTLMRQWKDQNKFRTAALVSGIIFGLIHTLNVFVGADPLGTLFQVISAIGIGVFFSAVYLRTGSIVPCMFYHTVHDILAIAGSSGVTDSGIIATSSLDKSDLINLVLTVVLAAIAFYMLRDDKNEEMRAIWNRKWKPAVDAEEMQEENLPPEAE